MRAEIKVRTRFVGWHYWPDAPEPRAYLRSSHRHEFHVEVCAAVEHDDRDIEFHDLKDEVDRLLPRGDLGAQSCEMVGRSLCEGLALTYGDRIAWAEVWEDGECGARVYAEPAPIDDRAVAP